MEYIINNIINIVVRRYIYSEEKRKGIDFQFSKLFEKENVLKDTLNNIKNLLHDETTVTNFQFYEHNDYIITIYI